MPPQMPDEFESRLRKVHCLPRCLYKKSVCFSHAWRCRQGETPNAMLRWMHSKKSCKPIRYGIYATILTINSTFKMSILNKINSALKIAKVSEVEVT